MQIVKPTAAVQHRNGCTAAGSPVVRVHRCGCGDAIAVCCIGCDVVLYGMLRTDRWCCHAVMVFGPMLGGAS
jgi:hypothetical protein